MRLHLEAKLEQQQILAPQMILSMDILHLNTLDLEARIEKEFMENPALELVEDASDSGESSEETAREVAASEGSFDEADAPRGRDAEVAELLEVLDGFARRYGGDEPPRRSGWESNEGSSKHEALLNHADRPATLIDWLHQQAGFLELPSDRLHAVRQLAGNIDERGYLIGSVEEIGARCGLSAELAREALALLQSLEPRGVGARDLRECLLLQLGEVDPQAIERRVIEDHLEDLLQNRMPRIAQSLQVSLAQLSDAIEVIALLDPHPGRRFLDPRGGVAIPEIFVDEVDGRFQVRLEQSSLPTLRVSPQCATLLQQGGDDPRVIDFVRRKIESARWLIHAIEQRRRTILDIAQAIVERQSEFFCSGPGHLAALTMQQIADQVRVHVSTVSRATHGKYIETPYGVMELRRFFTGGVERVDGGVESRDNVCERIREIVGGEDPRRPLSDTQLARRLQKEGVDIARRTVTKYRERAGVPAGRLRKRY